MAGAGLWRQLWCLSIPSSPHPPPPPQHGQSLTRSQAVPGAASPCTGDGGGPCRGDRTMQRADPCPCSPCERGCAPRGSPGRLGRGFCCGMPNLLPLEAQAPGNSGSLKAPAVRIALEMGLQALRRAGRCIIYRGELKPASSWLGWQRSGSTLGAGEVLSGSSGLGCRLWA